MMQSPTENSKPKPSTLATVTAGFELVTSHLWLLILPLSLDLFLWLGPKLSAARIIKTSSLQFSADPAIRSLSEQLLEAANHFNIFSILSLPVIGVPALMSSDTPELLPLIPYHWNVPSASSFLLIYLGLLLAGLFLSVLYLGLIARILRDDDQNGGAFLRHLGSFISESAITWLRLLLFGIFLFATMMMLML
ncbi:MAG: hypothetical protein ACK2T3_12550, partial [Candidatus Promineifilaceae bacterium]